MSVTICWNKPPNALHSRSIVASIFLAFRTGLESKGGATRDARGSADATSSLRVVVDTMDVDGNDAPSPAGTSGAACHSRPRGNERRRRGTHDGRKRVGERESARRAREKRGRGDSDEAWTRPRRAK